MNNLLAEHGTKLYGGLTAFFGTLQSLINTGAFKDLMTPAGIGWLSIGASLATAVLGAMTMARGFNNTTAIRVASAMETAIKATPAKEAGFARAVVLAILLAIGGVISIGISACTNTQRAISNAKTPSDFALVFLEGYDAALLTANQLKSSGALTPEMLLKVQDAERRAWPLVRRIDPLRKAYEATKSAEDAAALQLAIDNAIREAAEFIRIVRELRDRKPV